MFHENLLVFEHVTLHFQVQAMIHVVVNLLRFIVSSEQLVKNSHSLHPGYLLRRSSIGSSALSLLGMDSHRLPGDQPIFDQLPNLPTGVGTGDAIGLIGVQPDLFLFATVEDTGVKPLLKPDHTHGCGRSDERK